MNEWIERGRAGVEEEAGRPRRCGPLVARRRLHAGKGSEAAEPLQGSTSALHRRPFRSDGRASWRSIQKSAFRQVGMHASWELLLELVKAAPHAPARDASPSREAMLLTVALSRSLLLPPLMAAQSPPPRRHATTLPQSVPPPSPRGRALQAALLPSPPTPPPPSPFPLTPWREPVVKCGSLATGSFADVVLSSSRWHEVARMNSIRGRFQSGRGSALLSSTAGLCKQPCAGELRRDDVRRGVRAGR